MSGAEGKPGDSFHAARWTCSQMEYRLSRSASVQGTSGAEYLNQVVVTTALTRSLSNLDVKADRVRRRPAEVLGIATMTVKAIADRVRLLDPVNTMARGWSITRNDKGEVVRSVKSLSVGQQLVTSFADGSAMSAIESIEKEGK